MFRMMDAMRRPDEFNSRLWQWIEPRVLGYIPASPYPPSGRFRKDPALPWAWTIRRWVISAFVLFHLSALFIWTLPPCAIKAQLQSSYRYYVLPLGLWQRWALFAPYPIRETIVLKAAVLDAKGKRHNYEFPRIGDLPWWRKFARYRNAKFTANMLDDEWATHRRFTARHAVRKLGLGEAAFPMWVSLSVEIIDSPPPGTGAPDSTAMPRVEAVDRFRFESLKEVRP
jgi:hypothetical protein